MPSPAARALDRDTLPTAPVSRADLHRVTMAVEQTRATRAPRIVRVRSVTSDRHRAHQNGTIIRKGADSSGCTIARPMAMTVATSPSIFSVDFFFESRMFPAESISTAT